MSDVRYPFISFFSVVFVLQQNCDAVESSFLVLAHRSKEQLVTMSRRRKRKGEGFDATYTHTKSLTAKCMINEGR
jgi:hypothetical protein